MLIGLTGKAGSGKDTVYETLSALFSEVRNVHRVAFADTLKHSSLAAFGIEDWQDKSDAIKSNGKITIEADGKVLKSISGREYFQMYGTEAHRDLFGEDFWVDVLFPPLAPLDFGPFLQSDEIFVVTDVRYDNEALRIREYGGSVWLVERGGEEIEENDHASEQGVDYSLVNFLLPNHGSIDELKDQIAKTIIATLIEQQRTEEEVSKVSENAQKNYEELKKIFNED